MIKPDELAICRIRGHQEYKPDPQSMANSQYAGLQAATPWKICRWCGVQFQDINVPKQIENPGQQS